MPPIFGGLQIGKTFIRNYTRLALINTGNYDLEKCREYARRVAEFFGLMFEEIPGDNVLIRKLIAGDWDENFVIVESGGSVRYDMFVDDF